MNLKTQLKLYLREKGITAAELARRSHVSKQTISLWLAGSHPRKLDQVKKVADSLGISVDHLCFGHGSQTLDKPVDLDSLLGDGWLSGMFEVRLRRIKKQSSDQD